MPDSENELTAVRGSGVTKIPFLTRMLGLYKLDSHPSFEFDFEGDERSDLAGAKSMADWWKNHLTLGANRKERYRIFDEMDAGLVAGILDLISEESTQVDYDRGRAVWIESQSETIRKAGETCLSNTMMEDRIPGLARGLAKKGDSFKRLIYQSGKGVLGMRNCDPASVFRIDDKFSRLVGFKEEGVKTYRGEFKRETSWPWDYTHFRMIGGKNEDSEYGTGMLDSMFVPWRQLMMTQDAVLMYRMRRGPDRNMVLVDVNNMEEAEAVDYVNAWRKRFRKYEMIDPASSDYKKQYNPLTPLEDIFMPIRGANNSTRIESLSGSSAADNLSDLDHFRRAFFGTSRVPQAFLGFEGDINAKATLSTQSVRFANTCKKVQKSLIYGVRNIVDTHLMLCSEDDSDTKFDFTKPGQQYLVKMAPISALDEFERLEMVQLRGSILEANANLAQGLGLDVGVWAAYLLLNYAKLPEALVLKLLAKPLTKPPTDPDGSGGSAGNSNESREAAKRHAQEYRNGLNASGFFQLNEREQRAIGEAVHKSSGLRKILGEISEHHVDDLAVYQTDPTTLPPRGVAIEDDIKDLKSINELREDVAKIIKPRAAQSTLED